MSVVLPHIVEVTTSRKTFEARRRRAEAERLLAAVSSLVAESVQVLEFTHLKLVDQARDTIAAVRSMRQVRQIADPAKRWQELSGDIWQFLCEGNSGDEAHLVEGRGLTPSISNQALVAVAAYLRSTANDLDDLAQTVSEEQVKTDVDWVDDCLAVVYACSAVLVDVVENGSWRSFAEVHHLAATELVVGDVHELGRHLDVDNEPTSPKVLLAADAKAVPAETKAAGGILMAAETSENSLERLDGPYVAWRRFVSWLWHDFLKEPVGGAARTPAQSLSVLQSILSAAVPVVAQQVLAPGFLNPPILPRRVGQGNHLLFSGQPPPLRLKAQRFGQKSILGYWVGNDVRQVPWSFPPVENSGGICCGEPLELQELFSPGGRRPIKLCRSPNGPHGPSIVEWARWAAGDCGDDHQKWLEERWEAKCIAKLKSSSESWIDCPWSQHVELGGSNLLVVVVASTTTPSASIVARGCNGEPRTFLPDFKVDHVKLDAALGGGSTHTHFVDHTGNKGDW